MKIGKTLAAVTAISLLAFAGIAFAMPGWLGQGWFGKNQGQNGSGGMGGLRFNASWQNGTTWHGQGMGANFTRANSTQLDEFRQAVSSGGFAAASQLNSQYGLGSPLFGRLNETTFAKYSQIFNLQSELRNMTGELRNELGIPQKGMRGPKANGLQPGNGMGRRVAGRGFGFGRGMRGS